MKALLNAGRVAADRWFVAALSVWLPVAGAGQTVEVEGLRKEAEKGLAEAEKRARAFTPSK